MSDRHPCRIVLSACPFGLAALRPSFFHIADPGTQDPRCTDTYNGITQSRELQCAIRGSEPSLFATLETAVCSLLLGKGNFHSSQPFPGAVRVCDNVCVGFIGPFSVLLFTLILLPVLHHRANLSTATLVVSHCKTHRRVRSRTRAIATMTTQRER